MPIRRLLPLAVATATLLIGACGGDSQKSGADSTSPTTVTTTEVTSSTLPGSPTTTGGEVKAKFTIIAKDIAFVPRKLTIPVNQDVEILFDNQDSAVPHNIHFETPKDIKTDPKSGPEKDVVKLNVSKAGTYKYICDVHPGIEKMTGELTVS